MMDLAILTTNESLKGLRRPGFRKASRYARHGGRIVDILDRDERAEADARRRIRKKAKTAVHDRAGELKGLTERASAAAPDRPGIDMWDLQEIVARIGIKPKPSPAKMGKLLKLVNSAENRGQSERDMVMTLALFFLDAEKERMSEKRAEKLVAELIKRLEKRAHRPCYVDEAENEAGTDAFDLLARSP
jgi:hypothetical protein